MWLRTSRGILASFLNSPILSSLKLFWAHVSTETNIFLPIGFRLNETYDPLHDSIDTFILAHEYAHAIRGHPGMEKPISAAEHIQREFEADNVPLQLTIAAFDDSKWAYGGAVLISNCNRKTGHCGSCSSNWRANSLDCAVSPLSAATPREARGQPSAFSRTCRCSNGERTRRDD
jgi:hypothetical protein